MKQINASRFLAPVALAIALGASGTAVAQNQGGSAQGGMQQQAPDIDVSDEQVESFAEAQSRVAEIGEKWTPRMQEAESSEDVQKAREQAQQEMVIAVENAGLSVQEYNQIARAAQADEELREKIQEAQ
ncbi:DUF4168 domain-containing protein [Algiphilus aromaticivorans]|jgi:hypothetical protein|uniref:DUF4168 domain-containing protein n=1 Tax=Algiphilus aromaticivorans TaxID=382454 RepID=UPI000694481E|nr:DUF4168 domain-containing protein [Algiphilus aromaticivorans]